MRSGFTEEDYSAQRGYAYAYKQSQNCNNGSKLEDNIGPYFKQNQKNSLNSNQTKVIIGKEMLKKMENRNPSSPSLIAKLMGINEIPPQKGLNCNNNKTSRGSFHKIPEFKDVFEVIEERKKQKNLGKGQNRKKFITYEKFGDNNNFESYRDRFVRNLEKSNPLFAKHLIDLKCNELPHSHKNPVFVENPKIKKFGDFSQNMRNYNYNQLDDIVVLDPKNGDFELGPNLQRYFDRSFSDILEKRRAKDENYAWNFEKLRKIESSLGFSEKEPKTLAEILAQSDSGNLNSHNNYSKKVSKVRSAREINYEKDEGSFVILPRKNSLYEREDVVRLRGRNKKLKENLIFGRNFSSARFSEEDFSVKKHDLKEFYENYSETEEKTLFTIDEAQKVGLRYNSEQNQGRFSKYCERLKKLKETEQPSPVSVLDSEELESSSSCFVKDEMESSSCGFVKEEMEASSSYYLMEEDFAHDSDTQVTEEPEIYVSSDEENFHNNNNKNSTLNNLKDQEEREFSYLLDMLIQSELYGPHMDSLRKACHKPSCPVNPTLFDRLEKKYCQVLTWSKADRRLLFDCVNLSLASVLGPCLDPHPWIRVRVSGGERKGGGWGSEGLVETVWLVLERERRRERGRGDDVADPDWMRDLGDDVNVVGKRIERMITDEMLEETVLGLVCDQRLETGALN